MTNPAAGRVYAFGSFRLETAERRLLRDGKPVALPPKVFDTLVVLVEQAGHLVDKEQLMRAVWPNTFVEEVNLAVNISAIRKALGEGENGHRYVETVPKRGYRFTAPVNEPVREDPPVESQPEVSSPVEVRQPAIRAWRRFAPALGAASVLVVGLAMASVYVRTAREGEGRSASGGLHSMAVLPFRAVGQESGDRYLELGIADDLINKLSALREIVVRPTGAVRKYESADPDPVVAGKELKVDAVVEGNIQRVGDRIRVTVRLVSIPDGLALWSGKFDESARNIFAVEDSISERVAEAVIPQLTGEERMLLARRQGVAPEAHEAYLKGRLFWNQRTGAGMSRAITQFERAIEREPSYALAYAGLADTYTLLYDRSFQSAAQSAPHAKRAAAKALALDDTLAEAHASMAYIEWLFNRNGSASEREFRRAIDLNPHYATAHQWYGRYLLATGRLDEALDELRRAQQDDPLSLAINNELGIVLYSARRYDQAAAQFQQTLEMAPDYIQSHWSLGHTYERQRQYDKAFAEYRKAVALLAGPAFATALDDTYRRAGYEAGVRALIADLKTRFARGDSGAADSDGSLYRAPTLALFIARFSACIGDNAQALAWLERASAEPRSWVPQLGVDPQFDGLHGESRFARLLQRAGVPDAAP